MKEKRGEGNGIFVRKSGEQIPFETLTEIVGLLG
jgi:hypothetical protein